MDTPFDTAFLIVASTFMLALLTVLVINLLLVGRNRRLKHRAETLEMKTTYEKELMKTQVEVAENTLNDIARDLHDDVGQMLTFSIIQLNNLKPANDVVLENKLSEVKNSVQNTLQSVRSISKTLSNDYISSFGIYESLQRLFERIQRQGIIAPALNFPSSLLFRSRSTELFTFRIVQELINNTLKHADASALTLTISEENSILKIEYSDNGKGISKDQLNSDQLRHGLGLTSIYKRAELMKGTIQLQTNHPNGFYFLLTFPNE